MDNPTTWDRVPQLTPAPDFDNVLAVLRREVPSRPTLFEFILNERLYERLVGPVDPHLDEDTARAARVAAAFARAGYDYAIAGVPGFRFQANDAAQDGEHSRSLNEGGVIHDWESFKAYPWPDPAAGDYDILARMAEHIPPGMKLISGGPYGVLENAIRLVGYEPLCYLLADDYGFVSALFDEIGSRLLRHYQLCASYPVVGACISADDWGFRSQTLLSPRDMRALVFPWHKKIVEAIHAAGKPAILHSCGNLKDVFDDIVDDMGFDGRHSFEDNILPVEEAYEAQHERIAILGGIDVNFICQSPPEKTYERSKAMLERTASRGGYGLGTGNSVPPYVSDDRYFAMLQAVLETR